jgi:hypothetical protein
MAINILTTACIDKRLEPIEDEIEKLKAAPILSATRCDGSPIQKDAKLPLCEDLAEVDNRLSKEIDVVENNITNIRTDILVIKTDVIDIKTEILEIEQDIIVIKEDIVDLDKRVDTIEANPVLTLVGCDGEKFPADSKLPTCAEMTAADNALDARLDVVEAKTILTAVGCGGAALPANSKLPTCAEMTAADNALDARLGVVEAKTILTAVGCGGVALPVNAQLLQCSDQKSLMVNDEGATVRSDTTQLDFVGAGVTVNVTGSNAVRITIPQTVPWAGTVVSNTDLVGTTFLTAGINPQGTDAIDTPDFFSVGFTAPTAGVYTVGYGFALSAQGATGSNGVIAYTNVMVSIDGGIRNYLPGATFAHPDNPTTTNPTVLTDANLDALRIYLGAGAHTIALSCRTISSTNVTTHSFKTGKSTLRVTRINPQVV